MSAVQFGQNQYNRVSGVGKQSVIPFPISNRNALKFGEDSIDLKREVAALRAQTGDISGLLKKVVPATVSITLAKKAHVDDRDYQTLVRLLGKQKAEELVRSIETDRPVGMGSGFWIQCADGKPRILTNAHVVAGAGQVEEKMLRIRGLGDILAKLFPKYFASLNKNRTYQLALSQAQGGGKDKLVALKVATVPGTNRPAVSSKYDLAILEPEDPGFYERQQGQYLLPASIQPLVLETDMDANEPGNKVLKVGNSGGTERNVAEGIISAFRDRSQPGDSIPMLLVENTASISPGDSGGALVNLSGKVIGVNQSKLGGQEAEGVGWAIAAPTVAKILEAWGF